MKIVRIATLLFFLFICFVIFTADNRSMPAWMYQIYIFPNGDKVGHFCLYGVMAFLMNCSFPNWKYKIGKLVLPGGALIFALFALVEEISQAFFPSRSSSVLDLIFSFLGIAAFSFVSGWFIRHSYQKPGLESS